MHWLSDFLSANDSFNYKIQIYPTDQILDSCAVIFCLFITTFIPELPTKTEHNRSKLLFKGLFVSQLLRFG